MKKDFLKLDQNLSGLFTMISRSYTQMNIGFRKIEILEKGVGHIHIIVLPGVDEKVANSRERRAKSIIVIIYRTDKRGNFHEVRSGPCY